MPLSHEQLRRRKAIRSWIPAVILLVLSVAALSVAVTARVTDVGAAPTVAPASAVTATGTSLFTPAGLAYIAETRKVSIDARELPVEAGPLGLDDSGTLMIEPTEDVYEYLTVIGPGGGTRVAGTSIDIVTDDGRVLSASITDRKHPLTYRDARAYLLERAERFGIPAADVEGLADAAATAREDGRDYSYSIHTDDALGLRLVVTANCSSESDCVMVDRFEFE